MSEAVESGGGTIESLEATSNFVREYRENVKSITKRLRTWHLVSYFGILTLIITLVITVQFIIPTGAPAVPMIGLGMPIPTEEMASELLNILFINIVIEAVTLGLLTGKIAGGTFLSELKHSIICLVIVLVALWYTGYF